jgi:hypothetical protein
VPRPFWWSLSFRIFCHNVISVSLLSHVCCIFSLSHSPWSDHSNIVWWGMQIM